MDWISQIQSILKVHFRNIWFTFDVLGSVGGNRDVRSGYRYRIYD